MEKSTILLAALALIIVFAGSISVADITSMDHEPANVTRVIISSDLRSKIDETLADAQGMPGENQAFLTTIVNDYEMSQ